VAQKASDEATEPKLSGTPRGSQETNTVDFCWAESLGDCSEKLTREHIVS
jgi:hypothetical protein